MAASPSTTGADGTKDTASGLSVSGVCEGCGCTGAAVGALEIRSGFIQTAGSPGDEKAMWSPLILVPAAGAAMYPEQEHPACCGMDEACLTAVWRPRRRRAS